MTRRQFLHSAVATGAASALAGSTEPATAPPFELQELSIRPLQDGMRAGKYSSRSLVEKYLERIAMLDRRGPNLRHVLETNPDAVKIAEQLDAERKEGRERGPLHGVPILVKDNLETADQMTTTAGSLALEGNIARRDAFIVRKLRDAGAVLLGKANLSEWANFRSTHSSSAWSGRGGQGKNPYALDRNPSGSSSGSAGAVAASYCAAAVGTETDGSIVSPSSCCACVGIKPTVGLLSRSGIIPISHTQDTAGPIARSVEDAAILLSAMAGVDPDDDATKGLKGSEAYIQHDYTKHLQKEGLKGARLGLVRSKSFSLGSVIDKTLSDAVAAMKDAGATVIDPVEIASLDQLGDAELQLMLFEFKAGINAYLAKLGPAATVKSLEDLIAFNQKHRDREMPFFGQELFEMAQAKGPLDSDEYRKVVEKCASATRRDGIDAVIQQHQLDALVAITNGPSILIDLVNGDYSSGGSSTPAAIAGYPHITVPAGVAFGLPIGISFFGPAFSEPVLIRLAYAFEQITKARKPPRFLSGAQIAEA